MVLVLPTKLANHLDGLFEVDRLAEGLIVEGVGYDGPLSIIVHINLNTLQTVVKVL